MCLRRYMIAVHDIHLLTINRIIIYICKISLWAAFHRRPRVIHCIYTIPNGILYISVVVCSSFFTIMIYWFFIVVLRWKLWTKYIYDCETWSGAYLLNEMGLICRVYFHHLFIVMKANVHLKCEKEKQNQKQKEPITFDSYLTFRMTESNINRKQWFFFVSSNKRMKKQSMCRE